MRTEELAWLPATQILARSGARELDPQAVVRAHLEAIDRHDQRIHAYVYVDRNARSANGLDVELFHILTFT